MFKNAGPQKQIFPKRRGLLRILESKLIQDQKIRSSNQHTSIGVVYNHYRRLAGKLKPVDKSKTWMKQESNCGLGFARIRVTLER